MRVNFYLCDQVSSRKSRGIWTYTQELIAALLSKGEWEISVLTSPYGPFIDGVTQHTLKLDTRSLIKRVIADNINQGFLPDADVHHYPKGFLPAYRTTRKPCVTSILDTIIAHYNKNYRDNNRVFYPFELDYWLFVLRRTLKQTDAVVTISNKSAQSITEFCIDNNIKPPPIHVTYPACKYRRLRPPSVKKKEYILHFGSMLPHKRTNWLIEQWSMLEKRRPDLSELLIIGKLDDTGSRLAATSRKCRNVPPVSDEELEILIEEATAVAYPSEIEGFGFPALEAYSLGTPVIYITDTSVDEILQIDGKSIPGGFSVNGDELEGALDRILEMKPHQVVEIQQYLYSKYSWDRTADATMQVYRSLC
jgi:glycosyltransferase involved in cell wall biosynthesis